MPEEILEPLHQAIMAIPVDSLLEYLTGRCKLVNVPEGAKLINAWCDCDWDASAGVQRNRRILLRLEHESFRALPHRAARLPRIKAIYKRRPEGPEGA